MHSSLVATKKEITMQREATLKEVYLDMKEAGSASDFPALLGNIMYRTLIQWFQTVPSDWRGDSKIMSVADYRPQTLILGAEAEDLLPLGLNSAYQDSKEFDRFAQLQVGI